MPTPSIEQHLRDTLPDLPPTGRKLAEYILSHYPVAALGSVHALARTADVSSPSVVRLVQRLGFRGYPDFQAALRAEVEGMLASPISKYDKWSANAPQGHLLHSFANQVIANLQATLSGISAHQLDTTAELLSDPSRRVYVLGGRITQPLAEYFTTLMKIMRPEVQLLSGQPSGWPSALLDMAQGDVLLVLDIRRYENSVLQLVELAAQNGAEIVMITDRWRSPAAKIARHVLGCHIEAPSAWDSTASILVLLETLAAAVQKLRWNETQNRLSRLEEMYLRTEIFRQHR